MSWVRVFELLLAEIIIVSFLSRLVFRDKLSSPPLEEEDIEVETRLGKAFL